MSKLVITVQGAEGVSRSSKPLHCDEVMDMMHNLVFRCAAGDEVVSISITHEHVLEYLPK